MFKRFWPCLLITPPISLILGLFVAAVISYLMPKKYESFAVIEIYELTAPAHIPTEIEKLTNANVLSNATDRLDLATRWGTDRQTSIDLLRDSLAIEQIRGTDLIRIRARHHNREDARDIAFAVVQSYQSTRSEFLDAAKETRLQELQTAIAEQEQKVVELRAQKMTGDASFPHSNAEPTSDLDALHDQETDVLMQMKVDAATLTHSGSGGFLGLGNVILHDEPIIAESPVSPNVPLNLLLGALSGLLLGLPLALAIMALLHRLRPA
jgi:capsular polysaccharide biosynthesis protein